MLRVDFSAAIATKEQLAAALDAVMDGAQYERRTARANADSAERKVRQYFDHYCQAAVPQ